MLLYNVYYIILCLSKGDYANCPGHGRGYHNNNKKKKKKKSSNNNNNNNNNNINNDNNIMNSITIYNNCKMPVSVKNHSSGEMMFWEARLSEHQTGGRIGVTIITIIIIIIITSIIIMLLLIYCYCFYYYHMTILLLLLLLLLVSLLCPWIAWPRLAPKERLFHEQTPVSRPYYIMPYNINIM